MSQARAVLDNASAGEAGELVVPALRLGERMAGRGLLAAEAIPAILERQRRWGCRFGEALIADGTIKPVELAEVLAEGLGLPFLDLIADPPDDDLIDAADLDLCLLRLFLPWRRIGGVPVIACADPSPELCGRIAHLYGPNARIPVTAKFDIIWTAQRRFRDRLNHDAMFRLAETRPEFSARQVVTPPQKFGLMAQTPVDRGETGLVLALWERY